MELSNLAPSLGFMVGADHELYIIIVNSESVGQQFLVTDTSARSLADMIYTVLNGVNAKAISIPPNYTTNSF